MILRKDPTDCDADGDGGRDRDGTGVDCSDADWLQNLDGCDSGLKEPAHDCALSRLQNK